MSLTNTSDTRRLDINISGIQNISKLTFEPLRKSLYWINTNNATIERYDLRTKQLSTVAGYAANVTGTSRGVEGGGGRGWRGGRNTVYEHRKTHCNKKLNVSISSFYSFTNLIG